MRKIYDWAQNQKYRPDSRKYPNQYSDICNTVKPRFSQSFGIRQKIDLMAKIETWSLFYLIKADNHREKIN